MTPPSKWLFFPSPAAGGLGKLIVTNGRAVSFVGGVETTIQADASSTVYNSWGLGSIYFRDAAKDGSFTDDGLGCLWLSPDATNHSLWSGYIGSDSTGTYSVYATGTTTLLFKLEYTGHRGWTTNTWQFGHLGVDFTGTPQSTNTRIDVYHS